MQRSSAVRVKVLLEPRFLTKFCNRSAWGRMTEAHLEVCEASSSVISFDVWWHEPSRNNWVQQFKRATAPYQFALSTSAGCECVAHIVQGLTDLDANTTLLSVDGIGGGGSALPFVSQFHGSPSTYWWDDEEGVTHEICQGEGDALMPALFSLGLHAALCAVNRRLLPNERLLAFLDDIYALCRLGAPRRVVGPFTDSGPSRENTTVEPVGFASKRLASSHCRRPCFGP